MTKKKPGRPKSYKNPITISHTIESETLFKLNKLASFSMNRTDLINEAIDQYLSQ